MKISIHPAARTITPPAIQRIGHGMGITLLRCLGLLVPIVAALLIALLPIGTAVPLMRTR